MEKFLQHTKYWILNTILFLCPIFFLPFTQEYFITNKLYLLAFVALFLLLISIVQLLVTKKISWEKRPFDNFILLFLTVMAISIIFSSPNKIQALLNPNFGPVMMLSLIILYFYLSRNVRVGSSDPNMGGITPPLQIISTILSLITIIFFFQPFKNITLSQNFAFLKNPAFTPVGSQLDLAILLGFFVVLGFAQIVKRINADKKNLSSMIYYLGSIILPVVALFLTVYSLLKPSTDVINRIPTLVLPPFRLSWFAALEILKNPQTALIGIGPDNFSTVFARVKDFAYNQSPLWQFNSFIVSRSAILQIFTEIGILGLLAFGLLIFSVSKQTLKGGHGGPPLQIICLFVYLLICLFVLPSSLIVWFLFFVTLGMMNDGTGFARKTPTDLTDLLPIYFGIIIISFGLIAISGYFLGRSYASEYYFKKSFDGVTNNSIKQVYDNQRQAIILNPYIERFRGNFAQTNLFIANNIANKTRPNTTESAERTQGSAQLTEQDRQNITQAIKAAIDEGKALVSLNPQKADGWQNLASIYLNIINAAAGADVWTISSYQRAILADPQNPIYRVGLGGVYYSLNKYDDAAKFFEQAISLKPDWPNASYNYAWANFQKENYPQAVNAMQNVLSLLDPKLNKVDYEKVQKDLADFKKMLPKEEKEATKSTETNPGTLNLPTPPTAKISPKLELPKEASPEAK